MKPIKVVEKWLFNICVSCLPVPQIRFQRSEYSVHEDAGSVEVCVELVGGPLEDNVAVHVNSQSGTATGIVYR